MSRLKSNEPEGFLISYSKIGTVSIEELRNALIEDIHVLKDLYNIHYLRGARLKIFATDQYGREVKVRNAEGKKVYFLDTHHFMPACKDYDL